MLMARSIVLLTASTLLFIPMPVGFGFAGDTAPTFTGYTLLNNYLGHSTHLFTRPMWRYFLLFSFLWLARPCPLLAQAPAAAVRQDSLIKVQVIPRGRYSSVLYTMNDQPLTNATLRALLKKYPPAAEELRKERAQKRLALSLLPVFVAATIVGGTQADKQRYSPGSNFSKAPLPFSICLGAFFGSIVLATTNNHFGKALEAYNSRFNKADK